MPFAHTKLSGLDADRLIALIDPILSTHGVDGVELTWKTDNHGWLLSLTVERPGTTDPGAGVSLDDCSRLSRAVSAALDEHEHLIGGAYRLEVGTPGVERKLYSLSDLRRFAGKTVKIKLHEPVDGEYWVRGELRGVDSEQRVVVAPAQAIQKQPRKKHTEDEKRRDDERRGDSEQGNESGERILCLEFSNIHSAQLVLEWGQGLDAKHGPTPGRKR